MNKYILPMAVAATFATVLYVSVVMALYLKSTPAYAINGVIVRGPTH